MRRDAASSPPRRRNRPFVALRHRARFGEIYRVGQRRRVGGIVMFGALDDSGPPRVGVVAGKHVGGAVARNRAKRRLRAAMARAPLEEGTAYIVIATAEAVDAEFGRMLTWVLRAVEDIEIALEEER